MNSDSYYYYFSHFYLGDNHAPGFGTTVRMGDVKCLMSPIPLMCLHIPDVVPVSLCLK